ncbi:MAG: HU family DNA-binding protein [Rhodobacterales bacterium]
MSSVKTKKTIKTPTSKVVKLKDDTAVETVTDTKIDIVDVGGVDAGADEKTVEPNLVKKKDIYEYVSVSTGLRKRDVREAVDSLLEYMHKCLEDGKAIQVPPLGKIKPVERGTGENIKVHYKLTLKKPAAAEKSED